MNPDALPILPGPSEIIELWPMLLLLAAGLLIWAWSAYMERRVRRDWRAMRGRYFDN